jgi:hypothetical protein
MPGAKRDIRPTAYQIGDLGNAWQIIREPLHPKAMQIDANQFRQIPR